MGSDLLKNFGGFWRQNGARLALKSSGRIATGKFLKKPCFSYRKTNDFEGWGGSKINEKSIKNRLKNEAEDGVALGLDF